MSRSPGFGRGNLPVLLAGGGAVLVLAIVVFLVAGQCGHKALDPDCTRSAPQAPAGYAYASRYCVSSKDVGQRVDLQVPLTGDRSPASVRGLTIFSFDSGKWTRISAAQASADGTTAKNATAIQLPKTFAVFRRADTGFQVLGSVPKGAAVSPDAARIISEAVPVVYVPAPDGSVSGGPAAVTAGAGYGVLPAIAAESGTEAQSLNAILADGSRSGAHADAIVAEVNKGGFDGIELDYIAVDAGLRANFTSFVQSLATKLHASNRRLVLRLPLPRKGSDDKYSNTGAYDWTALGKAADQLIIAAERDQSIYRSRVPYAVRFTTTQVDPRKLILEVSPLSEERNSQGTVRTLSTAEALSLASQITLRATDSVVTSADVTLSADNINLANSSGAQWSASAAALTFSYKASDADSRTVWIENVFSVGYKLELAQFYRLGGVSVDNASADPTLTNIWPAIEQFQAAGAPLLAQPNPQVLRPQWQADGSPLTDVGNKATITWHTPDAPGRHTVGVIVSDGTMRVLNTTDIDVRAAAPGSVRSTPQAAATPGARFTPPPARNPVPPARTPSSTSR
jgi:hypothetical protein